METDDISYDYVYPDAKPADNIPDTVVYDYTFDDADDDVE
jgi:hypothetical protein